MKKLLDLFKKFSTVQKVLIIGLAVLVIVAIILLCILLGSGQNTEEIPPESTPAETTPSETDAETLPAEETLPETAPETVCETDPPLETVEAFEHEPIDFEKLKEINPDIYAWICVPGTLVDYPICQNPYNDDTYLSMSHELQYYIGGAIFTQHRYNSKTFNDPCTLIYGHTMGNGTLFGSLQGTFSDPDVFNEPHEIIIYLPDRELHYRIFASSVYSNKHILYTFDFFNRDRYSAFLDSLDDITEIPGSQRDPKINPRCGDHLVVLSTCVLGDNTHRYLVVGALVDDLLTH